MEKLNILKVNSGFADKITVVAVHQGVFHADDVLATALVAKYFYPNDTHYVVRVPHQTNIDEVKNQIRAQLERPDATVIIADVGRVYNPDQMYFDHHQYGQGDKEFGHAAAGLIYEWLKSRGVINEFEQEELDPFVEMVDQNDIGIYQGPYQGTFPWMVALHNSENIYSSEQDERFVEMVKTALTILDDIEKRAEAKKESLKRLKESKEILPGVLELPEYLPGWDELIFKLPEFNHIDLVVWYDQTQKVWKIQQVPDKPGSFGRRGRKVPYRDPLPKGCQFIHKGEFFGVKDSKEALIDYIKSI